VLIPQGLTADLPRKVDEELLNLKDLLSLFLPALMGSFENESVWRPLFSCKMAPNCAIFLQKGADNGRKWGFFVGLFCENSCQDPTGPSGLVTENWRSRGGRRVGVAEGWGSSYGSRDVN